MAVDMFLKIDDIKGESASTRRHKDEIEVLSWSWGMSPVGDRPTRRRAVGAGKVNVQDLSFTKYIDTSSPNLMQGLLPTASTSDGAADGPQGRRASPLEYLKIKMGDVHRLARSRPAARRRRRSADRERSR